MIQYSVETTHESVKNLWNVIAEQVTCNCYLLDDISTVKVSSKPKNAAKWFGHQYFTLNCTAPLYLIEIFYISNKLSMENCLKLVLTVLAIQLYKNLAQIWVDLVYLV